MVDERVVLLETVVLELLVVEEELRAAVVVEEVLATLELVVRLVETWVGVVDELTGDEDVDKLCAVVVEILVVDRVVTVVVVVVVGGALVVDDCCGVADEIIELDAGAQTMPLTALFGTGALITSLR